MSQLSKARSPISTYGELIITEEKSFPKKAFEPIVQIANLEKMGVKFQCSNFKKWIKTLAESMNNRENILIIERFITLKNELDLIA